MSYLDIPFNERENYITSKGYEILNIIHSPMMTQTVYECKKIVATSKKDWKSFHFLNKK